MQANAALNYSSRPYTYTILSAPTGDARAVTLAELKAWLKITNTAEDVLLNKIIDSVIRNAELYTKRIFVTTQFKTKRDFFGDISANFSAGFLTSSNNRPFQIRRTPLLSIASIKYFNTSNVETTILGTTYYFTETDGSDFSEIYPEIGIVWPSDLQTQKLQQIEIIFNAGWATNTIFLLNWPDLYQALLANMADVYVNRGDCSDISGQCGCAAATPQAKRVYDMYTIIDFAVC